MRKDETTYLRQELEQIPTGQLREMLHTELGQKDLDSDRIRLILKVLEDREEDNPSQLSEQEKAAWEKFKQDCAEDRERLAAERAAPKRKWAVSLVAAAAVVCLLILAIPPASGTENIFDAIATLSEKAISYFTQSSPEAAYIFQTDSPALQQIYDEVTKLGITDPVVPMWCPEGYALEEIKVTSTPTRAKIYAWLSNGEKHITYTIELLGVEAQSSYARDGSDIEPLEVYGVMHKIASNDGAWTATWTTEKAICSLAVDDQVDTLKEMIWSIYEGGCESETT